MCVYVFPHDNISKIVDSWTALLSQQFSKGNFLIRVIISSALTEVFFHEHRYQYQY